MVNRIFDQTSAGRSFSSFKASRRNGPELEETGLLQLKHSFKFLILCDNPATIKIDSREKTFNMRLRKPFPKQGHVFSFSFSTRGSSITPQ